MRRFVVHWRAVLGWSALTVYVGWNAWWLAHGRFAPALFKAITGLPAPTTGGTRAFQHLAAGNVSESLRANPFAVPIAALFVATIAAVAVSVIRGRGWRLSARWLTAWAALLAVAWVCKLFGDPRYW